MVVVVVVIVFVVVLVILVIVSVPAPSAAGTAALASKLALGVLFKVHGIDVGSMGRFARRERNMPFVRCDPDRWADADEEIARAIPRILHLSKLDVAVTIQLPEHVL